MDPLQTSQLLHLPDELLVQILSLCDPVSLLQLSRSCRSLRDILLATGVAHIWTTARLNYPPIKCRKTQMFPFGVSFTNEVEVPLPNRFQNITEPAYAKLMFEDVCTSCSENRGKPYPALQRRLCNACRDTHCVKRSSLLDTIKPFADVPSYTDEDENAWLASVRIHCPKQQATHQEDLYWRQDVEEHTSRAIKYGKVTKLYLETDETDASKARDQFERQWREWLEAYRVVNEGDEDARLAGPTGQNTLL